LLFVTKEDFDDGRSLKTAAIGIPSPVRASVNPRRASKGMATSGLDAGVLSKTGSGSIQGDTGTTGFSARAESKIGAFDRNWQ